MQSHTPTRTHRQASHGVSRVRRRDVTFQCRLGPRRRLIPCTHNNNATPRTTISKRVSYCHGFTGRWCADNSGLNQKARGPTHRKHGRKGLHVAVPYLTLVMFGVGKRSLSVAAQAVRFSRYGNPASVLKYVAGAVCVTKECCGRGGTSGTGPGTAALGTCRGGATPACPPRFFFSCRHRNAACARAVTPPPVPRRVCANVLYCC